MVSKNCPIIGENVGFIFVTQWVTILWQQHDLLKDTLHVISMYFKNGTVTPSFGIEF